MKKIIIILMTFFLFFGSVFAIEDTTQDITAGITPDSSLYFLDKFGESISLRFTSDPVKKAEKYLEFAQERSEELKIVQNSDKIENLNSEFNSNLKKASELARLNVDKDFGEIETKLEKVRKSNSEVLKAVLEKVPENAKKGIERAISNQENNRVNEFLESKSRIMEIPENLENNFNMFKNDIFRIVTDNEIKYYQIMDNAIYEIESSENIDYDYEIKVNDVDTLKQIAKEYQDNNSINTIKLLQSVDIPMNLKTKVLSEITKINGD